MTYDFNEFLFQISKSNPEVIHQMDSPSDELLDKMIDSGNVKYFPEDWLTEELQLKIVKKIPSAICRFKNPSETVQKESLKHSRGHSIYFIDNPSEKIQILAVKQSPYNIRFIDEPSEYIQLLAVSVNRNCLNCIRNPSETVINFVRNNR